MIVNDWPVAWREPVSLEEVTTGPPADALVDPMHKDDQNSHHDFDVELTQTPSDSKAEHAFKESRTKGCQE